LKLPAAPRHSLLLPAHLVLGPAGFRDALNGFGHGHAVALAAVPEPERDSTALGVLSPGDEHERRLARGSGPDLLVKTGVRGVHLHADAVRAKLSGDVVQVVVEGLGHGYGEHLDGSEPGREGPGVVLEEDAEEAFDRA